MYYSPFTALGKVMKQPLIKKGQGTVEEVPEPVVKDDNVLVRVAYFSISTRTETSGITSSGLIKTGD